jgi:hypothetical protein
MSVENGSNVLGDGNSDAMVGRNPAFIARFLLCEFQQMLVSAAFPLQSSNPFLRAQSKKIALLSPFLLSPSSKHAGIHLFIVVPQESDPLSKPLITTKNFQIRHLPR